MPTQQESWDRLREQLDAKEKKEIKENRLWPNLPEDDEMEEELLEMQKQDTLNATK